MFLNSLTAIILSNLYLSVFFGKEGGFMDMNVDENMRMQLLAEEFKLRKKQPPAWTRQKYRKYANFGANRKKKEDVKVEVKVEANAEAKQLA